MEQPKGKKKSSGKEKILLGILLYFLPTVLKAVGILGISLEGWLYALVMSFSVVGVGLIIVGIVQLASKKK